MLQVCKQVQLGKSLANGNVNSLERGFCSVLLGSLPEFISGPMFDLKLKRTPLLNRPVLSHSGLFNLSLRHEDCGRESWAPNSTSSGSVMIGVAKAALGRDVESGLLVRLSLLPAV